VGQSPTPLKSSGTINFKQRKQSWSW
jgi:hypothetical protein